MAPQSNPDSLPAGPDVPAEDSPSADDLLALIPDLDLLESSAIDARTAQSAVAAALGSGRKPVVAPKLTDQVRAATVRIAAPKAVVSDDPYADLMPELEVVEDSAPAARTIPSLHPATSPGQPGSPTSQGPRAVAPAPVPPVLTPRQATPPTRPAPSPKPAAPPPKAPVAAPAQPVAAAPRSIAPARAPASPAPAQAKPPAAARPVAPISAKNLPNSDTIVVPPVMDRDFIARNRIVELYLAGTLPVRGATVFERFCRENPQILDEIGLPERVHTGLRLLEASGKPEPWQEKTKPFWERPYVPAALAGLVLVLGIAALVLNGRLSEQKRKTVALQQLLTDQPLDAATATSTVYVPITHTGPAAGAGTSIGGSAAQLVNIKMDLNHSDFRAFRITIDRTNQGRVAILNNLIKDSNGALGFSLNTSALGAGSYQLAIEGLDWRGDPQPDSWATITIRH